MKIAISGKGGVGKSTVAAALCLYLARRGARVLALDSDPDANLASALGISAAEQQKIKPISQQIDLIESRTGAKISGYGQVFKLNPDVSDVAGEYAYDKDGVRLIVMGAVSAGGGGCACPENTFARALVTDLVLHKDDALVMDMEAGVEHLGRATARGVDVLVIVSEPGQRAIDCARKIIELSREIGIKRHSLIANKVTCPEDERFIASSLLECEWIGTIPYSEAFRKADRDGVSAMDAIDGDAQLTACFEQIFARMVNIDK